MDLSIKKDPKCLSKSYYKMPRFTSTPEAKRQAMKDISHETTNYVIVEAHVLRLSLIPKFVFSL